MTVATYLELYAAYTAPDRTEAFEKLIAQDPESFADALLFQCYEVSPMILDACIVTIEQFRKAGRWSLPARIELEEKARTLRAMLAERWLSQQQPAGEFVLEPAG